MTVSLMRPKPGTAAEDPGTQTSSRAAGRAGRARVTASASIIFAAAADPTVSRHPGPAAGAPEAPGARGAGDGARVIAAVRTSAPDALARTAGSWPSPPDRVVNTDPPDRVPTGARSCSRAATGTATGDGSGSSEPTASASDRYRRDAPPSAGIVASKDRSEERPA